MFFTKKDVQIIWIGQWGLNNICIQIYINVKISIPTYRWFIKVKLMTLISFQFLEKGSGVLVITRYIEF